MLNVNYIGKNLLHLTFPGCTTTSVCRVSQQHLISISFSLPMSCWKAFTTAIFARQRETLALALTEKMDFKIMRIAAETQSALTANRVLQRLVNLFDHEWCSAAL